MQRALLAAVLVGIIGGFTSFFVVLKRLAFIGAGVSHAAFGGVAIGLHLGMDPLLSGGLFATLVSWAIGWVSRRGGMHEDTVIGVFFAGSMALGVVLMSLLEGWMTDLFSFLFGNILAVTAADLTILAAVGAAVTAFLALYFKELLTFAFDEELARAEALPVTSLYYGLLTALAATLIVAVKVVGIVLVSALMVIPAAIGYELSRNFRGMLAIALVSGVACNVAGLVVSYIYDVPAGATMVLCAAGLFLVSVMVSPRRPLGRRLWTAIRGRRHGAPAEADSR